MWVGLGLRVASLALALLLFDTGPARACIVPQPFDEQVIEETEAIVHGRIIAYEAIRNTRTKRVVLAKLTFEVLKTYQGREILVRTAYWDNSTFGLPEDPASFRTEYGELLIVGLWPRQAGGTRPEKLRTLKRHFPELFETPWVAQTPCAPPLMGAPARIEPMLRRRGLLE